MADDEARPRAKTAHEVGMKLDDLSVGEIVERVTLLRLEIERLETAKLEKQRALDAAGSVFRRIEPKT